MRSLGKSMLSSAILAAFALSAGADDTNDDEENGAPLRPLPGDVVDLLILTPQQPVFLRMHMQIDGQSHQAAWDNYAKSLFRRLDRDRDQRLSPAEAAIGPWEQFGPSFRVFHRLYQQFQKGPVDTAAFHDVLSGMVERVTISSRTQSQSGANGELMQLMDVDYDGSLSRAELEACSRSLAAADDDDNELLELQELWAWRWRWVEEHDLDDITPLPSDTAPPNKASTILRLGIEADSQGIGRMLLDRFDGSCAQGGMWRQKNGRLEPAEVLLTAEAVERFDQDDNGGLDASELVGLLADPPFHTEFVAALSNVPGQFALWRDEGVVRPFHSLLKSDRDSGTKRLECEHLAIDFSCGPYWRDPQLGMRRQGWFSKADANFDGVLSREELESQYLDGATFAQFDENTDNVVDRVEYTVWSICREAFDRSCITVTLVHQNPNLFAELDTNRDMRLSLRECRSAARLLECDRDGDDAIHFFELAQRFRLDIDQGRDLEGFRELIELMSWEGGLGVQFSPSEEDVAKMYGDAPDWFIRMDANEDGDLSLREFIGGEDAFRRIDRDADGLIDPKEANESTK